MASTNKNLKLIFGYHLFAACKVLLVKCGKETIFLSQRTDESDENGGELANEMRSHYLEREKMEGNANMNGRTTEQPSKKEESVTPQLEGNKAIS